MTYLLFTNEADAFAAELQIRSNVQAYVAANLPDRLKDGGLIGINAADGSLQPDACLTTAWCVPQVCDEGWVVPMPEAGQIGQMTVQEFLAGVGGTALASPTFPAPANPLGVVP
ncbi:MAG: hypothetical protein EBV32_00350 [Proteobacteria bacterium]|uniref:Uncharacterized protein n=1 Tax=Candidatus Fonsibacter lacus TaxID=2576439 RepID=A0A964UZ11_9PROT|nr:hypothetical protein [Candidatus Fonsibacter lacus]NCU71650.1 hypothetical protein [Candidatus Fonsibacter lacus]